MRDRMPRGVLRPPPTRALHTRTAEFDGTQDSVTLKWPRVSGRYRLAYSVSIEDAYGPVVVYFTDRSSTGCTVNVSDRFTGAVDVTVIRA